MDIYNIDNWAASTSYVKNKIIYVNSLYYYSTVAHTSSSSFSTDLTAGKWGGVLSYNNLLKPYFFWKPDYGYNLDIEPVVNTIRYGDGYVQDLNTNINNILLKINLSFTNRCLEEHSAILHFLDSRKGSEKFYFVPPAPYSVVKQFICKQWTPSQEFYNSYSVKLVMEERV